MFTISLLRHRSVLSAILLWTTICESSVAGPGSFFGKKEEFHSPRQVVPVWSDTVLHQAGQPATRGFGGRVMFYGTEKHKAIRVDGTLVVYAWDDSQDTTERPPDRKYVFPADKLQSHHSLSRIGHSYSFWVPWDAAGGEKQEVTLITRFVSKEGIEVTSTPARVRLHGRSVSPIPGEIARVRRSTVSPGRDTSLESTDSEESDIRLLSYEAESADETEEKSRGPRTKKPRQQKHPGLHSSEIGLTRGFQQRNMTSSPTESSEMIPGSNPQIHRKTPPFEVTDDDGVNSDYESGAVRASKNQISDPHGKSQAEAKDSRPVHSSRYQHRVQNRQPKRPSAARALKQLPPSIQRGESPDRSSTESTETE
ncbi:MAG: hypothetical protein ACK526_18885 [Planctomyces sp.]|jgi:hypothetical protein